MAAVGVAQDANLADAAAPVAPDPALQDAPAVDGGVPAQEVLFETSEMLLARDGFNPEIKISLHRKPVVRPTPQSRRILVIGAGVSGLMTAWFLLDKGYHVTIIAKEWAWTRDWQHSRLTSQIAGALWEYPPGGCGLTEIQAPGQGWATVDHYREWAIQSYEVYRRISEMEEGRVASEFGLTMTKLNQFFYKPLREVQGENNEPDENYLKFQAIQDEVNRHRMRDVHKHNNAELKSMLKNLGVGKQWRRQIQDGYTHDAPVINTDKATVFLMSVVRRKGADFETREVTTSLADCGAALAADYKAVAIINTSGLGAKILADDPDVYPVRGAIKRIENADNDSFEHLDQAYLVPAQKDENGQPTKTVFCVPRNEDTYIIGSIIQPNNWQLNLEEHSPEVEIMWKRARTFLPSLNDCRTIPYYPLAQGLRPFSKKNAKVRAERLANGNIPVIHNYGHGGSGWTLGVGCARSAVALLDLVLGGQHGHAEANALLYPNPVGVVAA